MRTKFVILFSLLTVLTAVSGCVKTTVNNQQPDNKAVVVEPTRPNISGNKAHFLEQKSSTTLMKQSITATISESETNYVFISINKKLSFSYLKGWICKEVIHNERVDCYPEERRADEYDAGLDEPSVYYPDIVIFMENCMANKIPSPGYLQHVFRDFKDISGCKVYIVGESEKTNSEDKIDSIISHNNLR